jgi:O-antigen ligase
MIFHLLCIYAFLIPLEQILEVLFSIETIFKPYRIAALLLIGIMSLRTLRRTSKNGNLGEDIYLYLIFAYGIVITLYRMMSTRFGLGHFYNDTFQMGLYLAVFIIIRHVNLTRQQIATIYKWLIAAILINALYIFNKFYFLRDFERHAGFMDNPNYLAFGLVIGITFTLLMIKPRGLLQYGLTLASLLIMSYIFMVAGSRTALVVLAMNIVLMIAFSSLKQKINLVLLSLLMIFLVGFRVIKGLEINQPLILLNRVQNASIEEDPRIPAWRGVIRASIQTNFIGLGIGQFKARFYEFYHGENTPLIRRVLSRGYFLSPHSDYLALLVTYGVIGLVFYLIFLTNSFRRIISQLRRAVDKSQKNYFQFSLITLMSIVLFGIAAENFNSALYWIILSLCTKMT